MRAHSFALAAVLMAGSFQYSSPARACSFVLCQAPLNFPTSTVLPGNMAYFLTRFPTPEGLTLQTAAGEPIAASVRTMGTERVFAPDAPIAEGTEVVLTYQDVCSTPEPSPPRSFAFTAGPHEQLAFRAAGLSLVEQGARQADASGYDAAYFKVLYTSPIPSAALTPITTHMASLDGQWIAGAFDDAGDWELEILTSCHPNAHPPNSCGGPASNAPPGVYQLKVQTLVLGAETQPEPVSLQVELRCPDLEEPLDEGDDILEVEGTSSAEVSSGEEGEADAAGAVQDVVTGSGASADAGTGCSLGGRGGTGSAGWAAAALLLGSVSLRRRRR